MSKYQPRNPKYWLENEKRLNKKYGLDDVPGSGRGKEKEDGKNEYVLMQWKSTDKDSFKLNRIDIQKLILHADEIGKVPVFGIEFHPDLVLFMTVDTELENLHNYIKFDDKSKQQQKRHKTAKQRQTNKVKASVKPAYDRNKKQEPKDDFERMLMERKEREEKERKRKQWVK